MLGWRTLPRHFLRGTKEDYSDTIKDAMVWVILLSNSVWDMYMQVRFMNLYEKWISYLTVHFDEKARK